MFSSIIKALHSFHRNAHISFINFTRNSLKLHKGPLDFAFSFVSLLNFLFYVSLFKVRLVHFNLESSRFLNHWWWALCLFSGLNFSSVVIRISLDGWRKTPLCDRALVRLLVRPVFLCWINTVSISILKSLGSRLSIYKYVSPWHINTVCHQWGTIRSVPYLHIWWTVGSIYFTFSIFFLHFNYSKIPNIITAVD